MVIFLKITPDKDTFFFGNWKKMFHRLAKGDFLLIFSVSFGVLGESVEYILFFAF